MRIAVLASSHDPLLQFFDRLGSRRFDPRWIHAGPIDDSLVFRRNLSLVFPDIGDRGIDLFSRETQLSRDLRAVDDSLGKIIHNGIDSDSRPLDLGTATALNNFGGHNFS